MVRSFHRGRSSGSRVRRPMDWEYALISSSGVPSGSKVGAQVVSSTELNAQYTDPTLMGALLICAARTEAISAGNGAIAFGLIAWDDIDDTFPTQPPGPITNGNLDWIIRQVFPVPAGMPADTLWTDALDMHSRSKARRRLGSSRTIILVAESLSVTFRFAADCRVLIKE